MAKHCGMMGAGSQAFKLKHTFAFFNINNNKKYKHNRANSLREIQLSSDYRMPDYRKHFRTFISRDSNVQSSDNVQQAMITLRGMAE